MICLESQSDPDGISCVREASEEAAGVVQDHASVSQTRVVAERMVKDGVSGYKAKSANYMVPAFKEKTVEKIFSLNSLSLT